MNRHRAKAAGLLRLERLLLAQGEPISQAEAARRMQVNRSTIHRYLKDLGDEEVPVYEDEAGRIGINREAYLSNVRLNLHEAVAVYLAGRLLARFSDKPNAHTVEALLKLGVALEASAPQIGRHIVSTSEALRGALPEGAAEHQGRLEVLARGWAQGRKVRLAYRPLRSGRVFRETFAPYVLEPSAIGFSTYAIGRSDLAGRLRTRKVERMEEVELTEEGYEVPGDFDPVQLLRGAWGIWFEEDDRPEAVRLRFSARVARRVRESRWHPSEQVEAQADGGLIWRAELDTVEEFVWWVRGWGAEVEALEPRRLREMLMGEAKAAAELYGWHVYSQPAGGGSTTLQDFFG